MSHLPPRPHPHLSPPASSQPPAQQQRVRAVSSPQEGAFSAPARICACAVLGRGVGGEAGWRRNAPLGVGNARQRLGLCAAIPEGVELRGGGVPHPLAVPRPPLPGPEDVLPNREGNQHGGRRLDTVPSSSPPISTLRHPRTFPPLPTFGSTSLRTYVYPESSFLLIGRLQPSKGCLES